MSKKTNRFRRPLPKGQVKHKEFGQCIVPDCHNHTLPGTSATGLCPSHEKFVNDLVFLLPRIVIPTLRESSEGAPGKEHSEPVAQTPAETPGKGKAEGQAKSDP